MVCRGLMSGLNAYVFHTFQVCGWCKCVRLLSVSAMSGLCWCFLRFQYMAQTWTVIGKYGNYGGVMTLLQQG